LLRLLGLQGVTTEHSPSLSDIMASAAATEPARTLPVAPQRTGPGPADLISSEC
jgi:hypothetical protein